MRYQVRQSGIVGVIGWMECSGVEEIDQRIRLEGWNRGRRSGMKMRHEEVAATNEQMRQQPATLPNIYPCLNISSPSSNYFLSSLLFATNKYISLEKKKQ